MVSAVVRSTPSAAFHVCAQTSLAKYGQSSILIVMDNWRVYCTHFCTVSQRPVSRASSCGSLALHAVQRLSARNADCGACG